MREKGYVLFLTPRFYPQIGGVEEHVLRVSRELIKRGKRIVVITEAIDERFESNRQSRYMSDKMVIIKDWNDLSAKTKYIKKTENLNDLRKESVEVETGFRKKIIVYRIPKFKKGRFKKILIWLWFLKNKKIIQSAKTVHCHDVFYWYLPFRFIYFNKPVYTTFHGYESYPVPFKNIVIRKISEKLSWGNICVGAFIEKWYHTKPDFVTYGAVESVIKIQNSKISSKGGSASGRKNTNKKLKILFIGRLEKDTGVLVYLSALELLKDKQIKFEFEVCGDGFLRREAEGYGKVHGFVEQVETYIKKSDIVFASSYLSILQALIFKKNVMAVYDNPLKEDYLEMTSFAKWINIFNNKYDLINKIIHMKDNPDFYINSNRELDIWIKNQTWDNLSSLYIKLWSKSPN